ncbi:MAG: carbohydrate ABC transporter permease [Chloroflexi bacterium]|nr:carbohydrate ABC transporter permease [Chloroflexota bacterium]
MATIKVQTRFAASARSASIERSIRRGVLYVVVIVTALMFVFPYFWTVASSLKSPLELMRWPPTVIPRELHPENYPAVFKEAPFAQFLWNSSVVTASATLGQVLSALVVAYGFARLRFPARGFLFSLCLSTMILPPQVTIVPLFLLFRKMHWIDTLYPLIVPAYFGSAFSIFLLRQFIMTIPYELDEAAIIDGASRLSVLWHIIMPNSGPAIATVAVFSFLGHWNAFLEPFIFLNTNTKFTLPVGLRYLMRIPTGPGLPKDNLLMAASVMMTLPVIILFFVAQEYFVQGIVTTGLKG